MLSGRHIEGMDDEVSLQARMRKRGTGGRGGCRGIALPYFIG